MADEIDISKQVHSFNISVSSYVEGKATTVTKNTWDDWHLVPTSRPVIAPPSVKKYSQDIPGGNGEIDLTEALTGYPVYENRTGSIEFMVMHDGLSTSLGDQYGYLNDTNTGWQGVYEEIGNFINGKSVTLESEDVVDYYYKGRLSVNEWSSEEEYSIITIDYDLEPFKYSITDSSDLWKWDPFNFRTGLIRTYTTDKIKYNGSDYSEFRITGTNTPVVPTIFVSVDSYLSIDAGEFKLTTGNNKNPLIMVYPGDQTWKFKSVDSSSEGAAAIYFRERSF